MRIPDETDLEILQLLMSNARRPVPRTRRGELTVVAPEGMTIARGFGTVEGTWMTATELPDARDGPFVVFAPAGSITPGLLGVLAVANALGGVLVRNPFLFVLVPGSVLIGGLAGIGRFTDSATGRNPALLGWGVAGAGALLLLSRPSPKRTPSPA